MIIIRYLVRETLKSQLAILFILLLIFFCQKLVRILGAAVDGDIPANLVLSLLGLGVPEMAQLILPLSLFLGLLMTLGKLYTESEITVMHACGLSKAVLVKAAMILAVFTAIVAAVNVMWAGPWSFEGTALLRDFRITDFQDYQAIIGHQAVALDPNDTDQMDMRTLWNTDTDRARAELNWRITLVFTVFMMALMVVPLSVVNPRQGRVLSMLPAMLLYLLFFLIQTSLKSNGGKGKLDPTLWMWTVNLIYLALAIVLNLWDTVPVRRLRASFSRKGAV